MDTPPHRRTGSRLVHLAVGVIVVCVVIVILWLFLGADPLSQRLGYGSFYLTIAFGVPTLASLLDDMWKRRLLLTCALMCVLALVIYALGPQAHRETSQWDSAPVKTGSSEPPQASGFLAWASPASAHDGDVVVRDPKGGISRASFGSPVKWPTVSQDGTATLAAVVGGADSESLAVMVGDSPPQKFDIDGRIRSPAISPDSAKVAFVTDVGTSRDIALLDRASGELAIISNASVDEGSPVWKDASTLSFTKVGSAGDSVVTVDISSRAEISSIQLPGRIYDLSVSPDGRMFAMVMASSGGKDVWTVHEDGEGRKNLTMSGEEETGVAFLSVTELAVAIPDEGLVRFSVTGEKHGPIADASGARL